ncbi:unnamed protein product [Coregonus sp. 'balchen']|nr:unnamed protein product [Coregonus sp. 'balchen']
MDRGRVAAGTCLTTDPSKAGGLIPTFRGLGWGWEGVWGEPVTGSRKGLMKDPQQEQDPTNLYISNLPVSMDEQELENMLKPFGHVISTRILRDANGVSRGVGFARMESTEKCEVVIQHFNGKYLKTPPGIPELPFQHPNCQGNQEREREKESGELEKQRESESGLPQQFLGQVQWCTKTPVHFNRDLRAEEFLWRPHRAR